MTIQNIGEGIYRLPIPVPFPMKYVYCYLLQDKSEWSIIDAGLHYDEAIQAWLSAFTELGVRPEAVKGIYITHFHPDHFGLSAWLQEYTGAPVFMNTLEIMTAARVWSKDSKQAEEVGDMCREHGTPDELSWQITSQMKLLSKNVRMPKLTPLTEDSVRLGGREWEVVITPGHSDGHTCFYQPDLQVMLSADHILDPITPNISLWPNGLSNPLRLYIDSLKKVRELNLNLSLSAHHDIVRRPSQRIDEIIVHHEKRLERMFQQVEPGKTAFEVAQEFFMHRELNAHQWRFAIAETLSHLEYLKEAGRLFAVRESGVYKYKGI